MASLPPIHGAIGGVLATALSAGMAVAEPEPAGLWAVASRRHPASTRCWAAVTKAVHRWRC